MGKVAELVAAMADRTIVIARSILAQEKRMASGNLAGSLRYTLERRGRGGRYVAVISAEGEADKYAAFVEFGVNGTVVNHGSPFSFRGKNIAQEPIIRWLRVRNIPLRDLQTGRFIERSERNYKTAAFLIGRSIAARGLKPTEFLSRAADMAQNEFTSNIDVAVDERIDAALKKLK